MHVAVVSPEFPPDIGGVETYALEYSKALVALGHRVTVFTQRHKEAELDVPGVEIKPVLRMRLHDDRRALALETADAWHAMNAAYAWLVEDRPRLVVSVHGNDFLRPYFPLAQPDWKHIPVGWRLEGLQPRGARGFWIERTARLMARSLPRVRHILANSRYTEQALLDRFPACAGHTSLGYVGVADRFFSIERQAPADDITRLLTVCRLSEPRKNVETVLHALARLKDRRFHYTIVGDGKQRAHLEAVTARLGLADKVEFAGFVTAQQLNALYGHADLFILTSSIIPNSHEGFGIVYLEAAASGVPCLAARLAGAAEAVSENESGMFVEEPTAAAIEASLRSFLDGERRFDSEACRNFARRFTWRRVVEQALPHY